MFKCFLGRAVLAGCLSALWALPVLAQPVEFELIHVKKVQLVFVRGAVLLDISGCFVLGEDSNGIDPTTGENPALRFSLAGTNFALSKNIQTKSFKAVLGTDGVTVVGYNTGPTFGSEGDTQGLVRVRLRQVHTTPKLRSPDPCKRAGDFWRFEMRGTVEQASRQFRQIFELTIGDDTSGEVEVQVAVRNGQSVRGTSLPPGLALQERGAAEELALYDLQGRLIFASRHTSLGALHAHGRSLPNGVYLYVITVRDGDGQERRGEVQKLVVWR